jgi:peptidoglycan/xylan/chitin deacetylase (PgdA/CDA1 family)
MGADVAAHLDAVCRDYEPIDWAQFFSWRRSCRRIPNRASLLSFDGGLAWHAGTVFPLLQERGLKATFFIPAGALMNGELSAIHQIDLLLHAVGADELTRIALDWLDSRPAIVAAALQECPFTRCRAAAILNPLNPGPQPWARLIDPAAARRLRPFDPQITAELSYLLTHVLPPAIRRELLKDLFSRQFDEPRAFSRGWHLTWPQLDHMQSEGHTIGGLGFSDEPYSRLDARAQADDIARCAAVLREGLGPALRPFAYPYGDCTGAAARSAARLGFTHGFTYREGWMDLDTPPMMLPRVSADRLDACETQESQVASA